MPEFKYHCYLAGNQSIESEKTESGYIFAESQEEASYQIFEQTFRKDYNFLFEAGSDFTFDDHFSLEWFLTMKGNKDPSVKHLGDYLSCQSDFAKKESCPIFLTYNAKQVPPEYSVEGTDNIRYKGFENFQMYLSGARIIVVRPWSLDDNLIKALQGRSKEELIILVNKLRDICSDSPLVDLLKSL